MTVTAGARVVVVGAGFGGLWAAKALRHSPVEVALIDRNNYHTFFPLLYQIGAAELAPDNIVRPIRSILRKFQNASFCLAEVTGIDSDSKTVLADGHAIPYDYLIVATGSVTNYLGVPDAAKHAFPLRTLEQAVSLRNHILRQFERAALETDAETRRRLLTFTVVGGGPTGVEFSGALAELIQGPLRKDIRTLDIDEARVVLVEAGDALISGLPKKLQDYTLRRLANRKVDVRLSTIVSEVAPDAVRFADETVVPTETVVWTAGVRGGESESTWGLPVGRAGRIPVLPTLQVEDRPEVYVIGDLAYIESAETPPLMVAPVALQQGEAAARNILRTLAGEAPLPFHYRNKGTMAVIGRNAAVAHVFNRWQLTGFLAWVSWLLVHLYELIGFRNRLAVLTNWGWDYVFLDRVVRLIFPSHNQNTRS